MAQKNKNESVGDKFTKGFGILRQYISEKFDSAVLKTEEPIEFQNMVKTFTDTRRELADLLLKVEDLLEQNKRTTAAIGSFSLSVAHIGSHRKAAETNSTSIIQSLVPYTLQLEGHQSRFCDHLADLVVFPLQTLMNGDVKNTVQALKQLDVDRLDFDARLTANRKLPNDDPEKKLAQEKEEEARADYERTKQQITHLCAEVEKKKRVLLQGNLAEFIRAHYLFHSKSAESIRASVHDIVNLDSDRKISLTAGQPAAPSSPHPSLLQQQQQQQQHQLPPTPIAAEEGVSVAGGGGGEASEEREYRSDQLIQVEEVEHALDDVQLDD